MYDEATRKAVRFERPDFIPMHFAINAACWTHYPQDALCDLMEAHPFLFPDFTRPALPYTPYYARNARKNTPYVDDFGCRWQTAEDGITGTVTGHPLADWSAFAQWSPPDPSQCSGIGPVDWTQTARSFAAAQAEGRMTHGRLRHGHTFLQLCDLRGYENLLCDMTDEEPRLWALIDAVEQFNQAIIDRYVALGAEMISYAEDLGMQNGPMLSPAHFRRYIQPSYTRLMRRALESGAIVHMHSDGDIRTLADDLIGSGVQVINLQDLVNGVDWIASRYAGRICVELDIDRQRITPFGSPREVDALIRSEVEALSTPQGGLMMVYGLYPGVPLENVAALMDAMERYAFYHS